MILFHDRRDAGRQVAQRLEHLNSRSDVIVLGIPRGGIVVADEIALALCAPLDVFVTHKIGAPFNPELAVGAVASDGTTFLDELLIDELGLASALVEREKDRQVREIRRRAELYRRGQTAYELADKTVVLADDGVATGSTTVVALRALANRHPSKRILAVPVAPLMTLQILYRESDELTVLATPEPFLAVGRFYEEFDQVGDEEVIEILSAARERLRKNPN
jgi:putative phosphoribosyl transferase